MRRTVAHISRKDPFYHSKKTENSCSFRGALFLRNLGILDFYLTKIVFFRHGMTRKNTAFLVLRKSFKEVL